MSENPYKFNITTTHPADQELIGAATTNGYALAITNLNDWDAKDGCYLGNVIYLSSAEDLKTIIKTLQKVVDDGVLK